MASAWSDWLNRRLSPQAFESLDENLFDEAGEDVCLRIASRLFGSLGRFTTSFDRFVGDSRWIHRWRVAVKRLRYEIECLGNGVAGAPHYAALVDLQQRLGKICDASQRRKTIPAWMNDVRNDGESQPADEAQGARRWYSDKVREVCHGVLTEGLRLTESQHRHRSLCLVDPTSGDTLKAN